MNNIPAADRYTKADYHRVKVLRDQGLTFRGIGPLVKMTPQIARWILTREDKLPEEVVDEVVPIKVNKKGVQIFEHDKYYRF